MKVAVHGTIAAPAIAVIGTWDPLLGYHVRLLGQLAEAAHAGGRSAVAVMLDPDPVGFLSPNHERPVYDDWRVRLQSIQRLGVDAVLRVHFRPKDVDAGAAELFDCLMPRLPLASPGDPLPKERLALTALGSADRSSLVRWPDTSCRFLAFLAGPGDDVAVGTATEGVRVAS